MSQPVVSIRDASASLGGSEVLSGVSLELSAGEIVALAGPSGAGKSTLLRVVLGLEAPRTGTIEIRGRLVSRAGTIVVPPDRRDLAMVFQDLALWPHLSVQGNLEFALRCRGVPREVRGDRIAAVLRRVDLLDKAARKPATLSGGEQQRVALARALVQEPVAVLFDEPLANLDVLLRAQMLALLAEILRERRCAALYVTHEGVEASALADRIVVLEAGRVVQQGTLAALGSEPATVFTRAFVDSALLVDGGR